MFEQAKENIDTAQAALENAYPNTPDHYSFVEVMQCKAEYLFIINKIQEAYKLITKVMKYRIKSYGRTAAAAALNTAGTGGGKNDFLKNATKDDKKTAFYEAFDNLSMESSRAEYRDAAKKDAQKAPSKLKIANKPKTRDEQEDVELESEMQSVKSEIYDDYNSRGQSTIAIGADADVPPKTTTKDTAKMTYTSVSKFAKPDNALPAFVYKGRPIASHPIIADVLYIRGKIALTLHEFAEAKEMFDSSLAMMNRLYSRPSVLKLSIQ